MRKHAYRLQAVFFHRGTTSSGHYWVYIFDFKKEIWRKYNDGTVTDVTDTNEIFARPAESEYNTHWGPANPYFVVYVQEGLKDKLVESVRREMVELPAAEVPARSQMTEVAPNRMDVEMVDQGRVDGMYRSNQSGPQSSRGYYPSQEVAPQVEKHGDWNDAQTDIEPNKGW